MIGDSLTGCGRVSDLAYAPATDTLYGYADTCVAASAESLLIIDQQTGAGISVGAISNLLASGGLAIEPDSGAAYVAPTTSSGIPLFPTRARLHSVDLSDGTTTQLLWTLMGSVDSLAYHPGTGALLGSWLNPVAIYGSYLLPVHPTDLDPLFSRVPVPVSVDDLDGLVFGPAPPPTLEVPTLGKWGLVALAGVLAALAVTILRLRSGDLGFPSS